MVKVNEKNQNNKGFFDKKISANQLIDRINKRTDLTKEEKFEKVIDIAFEKIYQVNTDNWEGVIKKAEVLTEKVEKETYHGRELRIKEVMNTFFAISKN